MYIVLKKGYDIDLDLKHSGFSQNIIRTNQWEFFTVKYYGKGRNYTVLQIKRDITFILFYFHNQTLNNIIKVPIWPIEYTGLVRFVKYNLLYLKLIHNHIPFPTIYFVMLMMPFLSATNRE